MKSTLPLLEVPKVLSREPSALYRTMAKSPSEAPPTSTIFPSDCTAMPSVLIVSGEKSVVAFPSPLKLVSNPPALSRRRDSSDSIDMRCLASQIEDHSSWIASLDMPREPATAVPTNRPSTNAVLKNVNLNSTQCQSSMRDSTHNTMGFPDLSVADIKRLLSKSATRMIAKSRFSHDPVILSLWSRIRGVMSLPPASPQYYRSTACSPPAPRSPEPSAP